MIVNGMSESSCRFHRFAYVNFKFLEERTCFMRQWILLALRRLMMMLFMVKRMKLIFVLKKNDNNFIDDSEVSGNVCEYYRYQNVKCSAKDTLEVVFLQSSGDLENSNDVSNLCDNSDEKAVEIN